MSHRLRTRVARKSSKMGMNHHGDYSSSTTHFPRSYSIFGTPILIPIQILPLCSKNSINYISKQKQLLSEECPILSLPDQQLNSVKQANLTIVGQIVSLHREFLNKVLFFISMACCCLLAIFSCGPMRKILYTRYETSEKQYQILGRIIEQKLHNCEKLIINIQDNKFDESKAMILCQALSKFYQSNSQKHNGNKLAVIRNYCYFMNERGFQKSLKKLYYQKYGRFIFVWEKYKRDSRNYQNIDAESELLREQSVLHC